MPCWSHYHRIHSNTRAAEYEIKLVHHLIIPCGRLDYFQQKDSLALGEPTMTKCAILQYVKDMESKLAELRRVVEQLPECTESTSDSSVYAQRSIDTPVERLPAVQFVDKTRLRPVLAQAFAEMGVHGEPIGAEKVQEMIAVCGVQPKGNTFSQGIIEMREE